MPEGLEEKGRVVLPWLASPPSLASLVGLPARLAMGGETVSGKVI